MLLSSLYFLSYNLTNFIRPMTSRTSAEGMTSKRRSPEVKRYRRPSLSSSAPSEESSEEDADKKRSYITERSRPFSRRLLSTHDLEGRGLKFPHFTYYPYFVVVALAYSAHLLFVNV